MKRVEFASSNVIPASWSIAQPYVVILQLYRFRSEAERFECQAERGRGELCAADAHDPSHSG